MLEISQVLRNPLEHEYAVSVKKNTVFKENTLYFPGVELDGEQ